MKNKMLWVINVISIVMTFIGMSFMEDQIPAHYDVMGNVDRWGSKYESFILPGMILLLSVFWIVLLRYYDKKRVTASDDKTAREIANNQKVIYYVAVSMSILFVIMHGAFMYSAIIETGLESMVMAVDINKVTNTLLGVFLIVIGNIMPKCKMNGLVGIRTSWSMKNEISWARSNRFGGILLMIAGLVIMIQAILVGGILSTFIMLGIIIGVSIVCVIYSKYAYARSIEK